MIFSPLRRTKTIRLEGDRSASFDLARGRLVLLSAFFVLAYLMVMVRLVDVSVVQGHFGVRVAEHQSAPVQNIRRADIVDRNGVLLATSLKTASLYADAVQIADPQNTARKLLRIFPSLDAQRVQRNLSSKKRFVWVKRNITPNEQAAVLELGEPGLRFKDDVSRIYPQGALAAHIVGYGSVEGQGLAGMERAFDEALGQGEELKLALDIRLQHALRREMDKAIKSFSAKGGAGVIMDAQSGEVLAGVSLPDFDPHALGAADQKALFNRLTLGVYELGSIFKIFSTAAFLEHDEEAMKAKFDARKPLKHGRFTIRDYHPEERVLTLPEVFMHSSNIGSALMGEALGEEKLRSFYEDLGLMTRMDMEIKEVGKPLVPSPWRDINTLTASYGHGLATTPLQAVSAVASIVNDGIFVRPRFVVPAEDEAQEALQLVSQDTSFKMRNLLRQVVAEGTGEKADVPGYQVGGKTGTAEQPGKRGYDRSKLISSFVGVFPVEAPRYVVFIMVQEPKGRKDTFGYATGGWVAAPAVARVIEAMASILGLSPKEGAHD